MDFNDIRYLHVQILLHRQVLVALIRKPDFAGAENKYLQAVAGDSVCQCIDSACQLVELIDSTFDLKLLGPWWSNIQCIV